MDSTADKKLSSLESNLKKLKETEYGGVERQVKGNPRFSVVSINLFPDRELRGVQGFEVWVKGTEERMLSFSALKTVLYVPGKNFSFEMKSDAPEKMCDFSDVAPEKECCFSKKFGDKDFYLSGEEIGVVKFRLSAANSLSPGKPFKILLGNSEGYLVLSLRVPEKLSEVTRVI